MVNTKAEPKWLADKRAEAEEIYAKLPVPSRTDEEWRRTDLTGLRLDEFIKNSNGSSYPLPTSPSIAGGGVILPLAEAPADKAFTIVRPDRDKFAALHAAKHHGGVFINIPDGAEIAEPIVINHTSVMPHTIVVAGKNSKAFILEDLTSGDDPLFATGSTEIFAGEGSSITHVSVNRLGRHAWRFANQRAMLGKDANVELFSATLGGKFSKLRVQADLDGPGARALLRGIYAATGDQFFDFHTLQDHEVGNTTSDLLFKGVLKDRAQTVYAGLIRIEKGAARSDAYQANRNLVLSDHAKASSIPMLEIDNNDVRCTHGATVGPIDPMHLFYLESRGIPKPKAEEMIVTGFLSEVLQRIPFDEGRELIEAELEKRLATS